MLTDDELALLRSNGQRYRLYLAKWGTWEIQQSTPMLSDASTTPPTLKYLGTKAQSDFKSIVNIGSNRLGFVGEALTFDCSQSYRIHNNSVGSCAWSFPSGSPSTSSSTSVDVTWSDPGLYEITCTIDDTVAKRWVRIHTDRTFNVYDIIAVNSVSGSTSGGWKTTVTAAPSDDVAGVSSETLDLADFQALGIFIEEEYQASDGTWTRQSISGYSLDPTLVIAGYIEQGTIHVDANTHNVQFELGSVADEMNIGYINATQTWNKVYIDADKAAHTPTLPDPVQGVILDMSTDTMVMPDIIIWWLQNYTDILDRHDFYTWYDTSQQTLDTISTSEGSIWSAFGALADNEFAWWFADQGNGLHFEPNPHIRSSSWWNTNYPVREVLTDEDVITYDITQDMQRNIIWAQLTGTQVRTGKQWTVRFPGSTPGAGAGTWYMKNDLNVSRESFLDGIIDNVFNDQNRKITINVNTALNRAFRCPDSIQITTEIPDRSFSWTEKAFSVSQITYNINVTQNQFLVTLAIMEFIT